MTTVPLILKPRKNIQETEGSIQSTFIRLINMQPWARVLRLPRVPKGRVSDPKVKLAKARLKQSIVEYKTFLESKGPTVRLMLWRQNVGWGKGFGKGGKERPVQYGQNGCPDLIGLARPEGRMVGIEFKSKVGKQSLEQTFFEEMFKACGGVYVVVRDPREGVESVSDALLIAKTQCVGI